MSDIVFIAVDTPPTYSGDADLSRVMGVVEELEQVGTGANHVLVMKSTVPVGTGERVRAELDARGLGGVGYCSNPEFLKEGAAIADFLQPDRVVIGAFDDEHGDRVAALYAPLGAPIVRTSVPSAEMVKYASNAFLATKISFINEIANVCEEVGADVAGGRQRHGPRLAHRQRVPARRHRLRRQLLPQGRLGPQAAGRQLGLPLPAAHLGDRGQRAPEAPRDRQAQEAPRAPWRARRVALLGPRVQARDRRHARGVEPGARRPAAGRGRRGARLRPDRRHPVGPPQRRHDVRQRRGGDGRRRRGRAGDRVGLDRGHRLGARSARPCARRCSSTAATPWTRSR